MSSRTVVFALAGLCMTPLAQAGSNTMYCGNELVQEGHSTYRVRSRCGPPDQERTTREYREVRVRENGVVRIRSVEVQIDHWLYDRGPQEFVQHLRFEQNKLRAITQGDYGTNQ